MDVCMDGCMNGWMDGWMYVSEDIHACMYVGR